jgi:hypothetical protein
MSQDSKAAMTDIYFFVTIPSGKRSLHQHTFLLHSFREENEEQFITKLTSLYFGTIMLFEIEIKRD